MIPNLPILHRKLGPSGEIMKYKARLTADRHRQQKWIDYEETFGSVAKQADRRDTKDMVRGIDQSYSRGTGHE